MHRKAISFITAFLLVLALAGMASALGGGNARKGKFLYRKNCRSCHGQAASDLSPSTYTQKEWIKKFEDPAKLPCNADWSGKVSDTDLNDIFSYLHDFAKDSPSPAKCS